MLSRNKSIWLAPGGVIAVINVRSMSTSSFGRGAVVIVTGFGASSHSSNPSHARDAARVIPARSGSDGSAAGR